MQLSLDNVYISARLQKKLDRIPMYPLTTVVAVSYTHLLFPFRTQKLSLVVPKILGWRRPGKIGRCRLFSLFGEKPAFSPKYGPLVKRLRRRPLTAKSGVRFSQGSPFLCSAPHLLRLFCTFSSVGRAADS